jgi:hypothetical protein
MGKTKISERNQEEDFLVKATFLVGDAEINDVPCKIYLPERNHEKPYIVLNPSRVDAARITGVFKAQLSAFVYGFDKNLQATIEAPEVFFTDSSNKHWGDGVSESKVFGEPQDLHVIRHFDGRNSEHQGETNIVFWISPNRHLSPALGCELSYTGDISYDHARTMEFDLGDGLHLKFDKHFKTKNSELNGDLIQWSFLVACSEAAIPAAEVEELKNRLLPKIDDFLLVASLAARSRTACLGWTASDENTFTTYYRGNYAFPDGIKSDGVDDGVVDFRDIERFMQTCYPSFEAYENKLALRNALYSAVPSDPTIVETTFLHAFAGLETLVLDYRKRENLEFVLARADFADLRGYLQDCIRKSVKPELKDNQRASIYNKLGELNRVSLKEAYDMFCETYDIDLADLWPVFGGKEMVGLSDIRNKLIHGDPFPHELFGSLIAAKEHLKFTLERALVRILGWNIAETKVRKEYLPMVYPMNNLGVEQERCSKYILGKS